MRTLLVCFLAFLGSGCLALSDLRILKAGHLRQIPIDNRMGQVTPW
jgi:hypothetical protein